MDEKAAEKDLDTGTLLALAEAEGHEDPVPEEVTAPSDPSYAEPDPDATELKE